MDEYKRSREKQTTLNENSIITFSYYKINIPTDFFKITEQETSIITKKQTVLKDFEDMPDANQVKTIIKYIQTKIHVCEICGLRELV